ncbi:hypothetical protein OO009_14210 [Flavobacteriaceae bacterium KMM 6897]|nr:hypothetical protein [Flavobacteriaceae bacterium KMM 6897]
MRIALIIIIGIHGIIHLFGFLKAFGLSEFNAISQPISKPFGIIWLLSFMLFAVAGFLLSMQSNYWLIFGIIAAMLSQFLIISYWKDAKFGTILNLAILISTLLAYSTFNFQRKINIETKQLLSGLTSTKEKIITEQMIVNLPFAVQNWLLNSGMVGNKNIKSVFLEHDAQIVLKPEQKDWNTAKTKQYFTIEPPAFNWSVNLKMNPLINVVGRDKFENGKGEMTMKIFSLIPVVNAKNNKRINQATMQRYLAEIVWFPSAALNPYITWEAIDDRSARATMIYNGTEGSGVFHFDENGYFKSFIAMRYKDANDNEPTEWTVTATKTEARQGIEIPVEAKAEWKLNSGKWTWLKLKITNIEYNVK